MKNVAFYQLAYMTIVYYDLYPKTKNLLNFCQQLVRLGNEMELY